MEKVFYYHGGPRGLRSILPAAETGAKSTADMSCAKGICNPQKAYVTTDYSAALLYAAAHDNGTIYLVAPVNLSPDPDCSMPGLSFECDSASIIRKVPPHFKHIKKARMVLMESAKPPHKGM